MNEKQVLPNITVDVVENQKKEVDNGAEKTVKVFDTKNYFDVKLKGNEETKEIIFRLLPLNEKDNSPFRKVHMHSTKVRKEIAPSGRKSYICLERTEGLDPKWGKKCPFCDINREAYKAEMAATTEAEKEKYAEVKKANMSQENWIIRAIDRANENDGPKFWMFGASRKKTGLYDRMVSIFESRRNESIADQKDDPTIEMENIFDLVKGRDLKLIITKGKDNKQAYNVIDTSRVKPLSKDVDQMLKWCYDEKKWYQVFTPKAYEYISIVVEGGIPWFDKQNNCWVTKEESDIKNNNSIEESNNEIKNAEENFSKITENLPPQVDEQGIETEELPF